LEDLERTSKIFDEMKGARTAYDFSKFEDVWVGSATADTGISGEEGREGATRSRP
jgi:hypothetical protein